MGNIISFTEYKSNHDVIITLEDIFNLFLIFKRKEELLAEVDVSVLSQSFSKYKNLEKFNLIFKNILLQENQYNNGIIDLSQVVEKKQQEKLIVISSKNRNEIFVLASEEKIEKLSANYDEKILNCFRELMFCVNNDLKFGIDNWETIFEDEIIDVSGYPSIVTAEFIGKNKNNPRVKEKIKKRAIENVKRIYK